MKTLLLSLLCALSLGAGTYVAGPRALPQLPLRFEAQPGQRFAGKGFGYRLDVSSQGYRMTLADGHAVAVSISGADPGAAAVPSGTMPLKTNYLRGKRAAWRTDVSSFQRIDYKSVLPGIDLAFYGAGGRFEFDFIVNHDADPSRIALHYSGQESLQADSEGNLLIGVGNTRIVQQSPAVYQRFGASIRLVSGNYAVNKDGSVSFVLGPYDRSRPLVIDPAIQYSAFVSGNGADTPVAIARDSQGLLYVAGSTRSTDLTASDGAGQPGNSGDLDLFVMKINPANPAGKDLLYLTYIGGIGTDDLKAMTIDASGSVYLAGSTNSADFPTTSGAPQKTQAGDLDGFVLKLDTTRAGAAALVYSTYLGGTGPEIAYGIAVDATGVAYVTGYTGSTDFPMAGNPVQSSNAGGWDAFVVQYNGDGALAYSTYLGGDKTDSGQAIALAKDGSVVIAGKTLSATFPTAGTPYETNYRGGGDAFVTRLSIAGGLVYSTFFGGSNTEELKQIALNAAGQVVLTGTTLSTDLPVSLGALQTQKSDSTDIYVAVLDITKPGKDALVYSTYFGGAGAETPYDVKIDGSGYIVLTGYTGSLDFPVTAQCWQPQNAGGNDAFISKLDPTKTAADALVYSTYIGGAGTDLGYGVTFDAAGVLYVTGSTTSRRFPASSDTVRDSYPGDYDGFIIGFQPCAFTLSSDGNTLDAGGGVGSFLVTATTDCSWNAASAADWVTIKDGNGAGRGNGSVAYTAAPNTAADPRTVDILVGDKKYTVRQNGAQ